MLERDVVEIEVASKIEFGFDKAGKPTTENATPGELRRQPAQCAQRSKRRMLRVVNKIAPVAMFIGPATGENRGDARRTVAEDGVEAFAIGREGADKRVMLDDLPTAGIDKNK